MDELHIMEIVIIIIFILVLSQSINDPKTCQDNYLMLFIWGYFIYVFNKYRLKQKKDNVIKQTSENMQNPDVFYFEDNSNPLLQVDNLNDIDLNNLYDVDKELDYLPNANNKNDISHKLYGEYDLSEIKSNKVIDDPKNDVDISDQLVKAAEIPLFDNTYYNDLMYQENDPRYDEIMSQSYGCKSDNVFDKLSKNNQERAKKSIINNSTLRKNSRTKKYIYDKELRNNEERDWWEIDNLYNPIKSL